MVDYDKLLKKLSSIDENMGIYPAAMEAHDKEKSYKERDGFKNGWNAAVREYGMAFTMALDEAGTPWETPDKLFVAAGDDIFWLGEDGTWAVFLNDTWYYASADAEDIPEDKKTEVANLFKEYGYAGVLYWVWLQRGDLPSIPSSKRKVEIVIKCLEEDLEANKKRTRKRLIWLTKGYKGKAKDPVDIARDLFEQYQKTYGSAYLDWQEFRSFVESLLPKKNPSKSLFCKLFSKLHKKKSC